MLKRRLIGAVPVILGISLLVFLLMHIAPGDPVTLLLGDDATPADVERMRREWGLDRPLMVQYADFLKRAVTGDFGRSLKFNEPVIKLIAERLPATLELAFAAERGIAVTRVPAYSPHGVAEHAVALLLAMARKMHRAYKRVRKHGFSLSGLVGTGVAGKTVYSVRNRGLLLSSSPVSTRYASRFVDTAVPRRERFYALISRFEQVSFVVAGL